MHHHPANLERALNLSILALSGPGRFPVLGQIKPQTPLLVCPPVNSFKFQPCHRTPPEAQTLVISLVGAGGASLPVLGKRLPISGRHRLWLRLRRYLIVFDPPTFVLDQ